MNDSERGPRIWDVPCALLDAVLVLAFDEGELSNLAASTGGRIGGGTGGRSATLLGAVHRASHEENALSRRLEKILHYRFADLRRECDAVGVEPFARFRLMERRSTPEEFAGSLWAVATSAQPESRCVTARANRGVMLEAFACLRDALAREGTEDAVGARDRPE